MNLSWKSLVGMVKSIVLRYAPSKVWLPPISVHMCKYTDQKGTAAMLSTKRSAGVTPEVSVRNPLHNGEKACKQGIHPGFETQCRRHQMSKTGVSAAWQKDLVAPKY